MIKSFQKNTVGRDFVVGDIHGMFRALEDAILAVSFDETKDRLFSVGDLVDRGPESGEFDNWLSKSWFHAVRGNHEQMMLEAAQDDTPDGRNAWHHFQNGGQWMYGLPDVEIQCYAILAQELPIGIEVETDAGLVGIVHAECPLDDWGLFKSLYRTNTEYFDAIAMWSRKRVQSGNTQNVEGVHKLYVGHTPGPEVVTLGNVVYTDTGACFRGGKLTIIQIN
ncbi:Serine/threonine-protein phosphatase 1 [compost metagenome]